MKTFNLHKQSLFNHSVYKLPRLRVLEDDLHVILYHLIYETMSLEMFDVVNDMWGLLKVLLIALNPELY